MPTAPAVRPSGRTDLRSLLLVLVVTLVVGALAALAPSPRPVAAAAATTTTDLNLRSGPGTTHAVILVMPPGATVEIVGGPQSGFYQVTYSGTTGWASGDFLRQGGGNPDGGGNPSGGGGTATVTSSLNLRAGPSTGDRVLAVMPAGTTVTLTGNSANGFLSVTYNGLAGWAFADFLRTGGNPAPQPTPSPTPAPNPGGTGTATVTTSLNLRAGPSTSDAVLALMPAGATVTLTGNSANGFLSVRYNGIAGWAYASYLNTGGGAPAPAPSPTPSPAPGGSGTATVTTGLNLRSGPGTNYGVLAVMPAGATVTLTGNSANGFLSLTYNGLAGWAAADFLRTGGTPAPAPAPNPTPAPGGTSATTTTALNLRSGPSTGNAVLTVMPAGVAVSITGAPQNGFHPISYAGQTGWAYSSYLSFGGSTPSPAPSPAPNPAPGGGSGIVWPFASGGAWQVVQGYNGYTHQNRGGGAQYYYALDFARVDGNTAGQAIYSPVSGTIRWTHAASGGIAIDMGNGYILAMFHCTFASSLRSGQAVRQGQYLGTISGPGGPGYAVTPHLDMTLWRSSDGGFTRSAAPFSGANAISGVSFPDVGGFNQHYGKVVYP